VSPADGAIGSVIVATAAYEPHVTAPLRQVLRPGSAFVDVGANVGYFSILAGQLVGPRGRVYAFEPSQRNCTMMQLSANLNHLDNLDIYPFAVADEGTTVVYDALLGSNGIIGQGLEADDLDIAALAHKTLVRAVRLDVVLGERTRVDVLKMDVEGAEYRALLGAERLVERQHPIIFSEYSPGWLPDISGVSGEDYLRALVDLGYALSILVSPEERIDCDQDVLRVLDYFEAHVLAQLDLMARPVKRGLFAGWLTGRG
jgi:FkbM family methyltransferase